MNLSVSAFQERLPKMDVYLHSLRQCEPMQVTSPYIPEFPAIYAFFENNTAVYVGRAASRNGLKGRIRNHLTNGHNGASFVYKRTCGDFGYAAVYQPGNGGTRSERMKDPTFIAEFQKQRKILREMSLRYVQIEDHIDQYLFELYATLHYNLPTDGFGTH